MADTELTSHYVPLHDYGLGDLRPRIQSGAQPQRLLLSLLGTYWREPTLGIPSAALVELVGEFDITSASGRVALSRLARRGFLRLERSGRNTAYALTDLASTFLEEGRRQIFTFGMPTIEWDGRWRCVAFSVPENDRRLRHLLRGRLRFAGFAPLYDGLWVSPNDRVAQAVRAIDDLGVPHATVFVGEVGDGVRGNGDPVSAWELPTIRSQFEAYMRRFAPVLKKARAGRLPPSDAMIHHFYMIDEWLFLSFDDPDLPDPLLPADWPRDEARALFVELNDLIAPLAATRVRDLLSRRDQKLGQHVGYYTVANVMESVRRDRRRAASGQVRG